ncbi:Predicted amidohydrolase [Flavobacteriaceae bacterium MAR_2010_188]|nr:Predicted amidohydrolase [Flavobacteriaceae bacterium MAR_2010_188]
MEDQLKVAILQSDLVWENAEENRINFTNQLIGLNDTVDLIVLPEMFSTGFSMNAEELYETMEGDTINWMQKMAGQKHAAIIGSLIIKDEDKFYNRLFFVHPNGKIETYDKRHTFSLAGEHEVYEKGTSRLVVDYKGWKICPLVCYDLRFPAWSRNTEDFDVLIYVANWPEARIKAWDILLQARAIENMCYSVGVNRVGEDGNGYNYVGHSAVYDMLGKRLDELQSDEVSLATVVLDQNILHETRNKLNFLADRDVFEVLQNHEHNQN